MACVWKENSVFYTECCADGCVELVKLQTIDQPLRMDRRRAVLPPGEENRTERRQNASAENY